MGGRLVLAEVGAPVRAQLARTGLLVTPGRHNVFAATEQPGESREAAYAAVQACAAAQPWMDPGHGDKTAQMASPRV